MLKLVIKVVKAFNGFQLTTQYGNVRYCSLITMVRSVPEDMIYTGNSVNS